jgi:hypothetical protein
MKRVIGSETTLQVSDVARAFSPLVETVLRTFLAENNTRRLAGRRVYSVCYRAESQEVDSSAYSLC